MNLPVQHYRLREVAEAGLDLAGFASAGVPSAQPAVTAIGQCFAFHNEPLKVEAQREGISWHEWLLRRTLAGLWEQSCKKKTYVCYTLHPGVVRLFFCSKPSRFPAKFHELISATSAYIEQGQDSFPSVLARSLAFWEAPCTAVALWPRGLRHETDGARVVDTGNAMSFFSYPESEHDGGIPVDEAGPEYVRVPQQEHGEFEWQGRVYRCLNRWDAGTMDLKAEFD